MINVTYHRDGVSWWAESSALPGWTATSHRVEHLRDLAREGVSFITGRVARTHSAFYITDSTVSVNPAGSETFDLLEHA